MGFSRWGWVVFFGLVSQPAWSKRLSDYPFYGYEVLFTNPECREYRYPAPIESRSGGKLESKPRGAYCKPSDLAASASRESSPQRRLIEWISNPAVKEVFFAYLSFTNEGVGRALCEAIQKRDVKLTFVLDRENEADPSKLAHAKALLACKPRSGDASRAPQMFLRGHTRGLGYGHNKIMIFNPRSSDAIRVVFSSGNLSAGVALHHENWHFISTHVASHFARAQLCMMEGMLAHGETAADYRAFISQCRRGIGIPEEEDIRSFFVPGEGEAATQLIEQGIRASGQIDIAAHRFSYNRMMAALDAKLTARDGSKVRLVADDDLHWVGILKKPVGPNMWQEFVAASILSRKGMEVRFVETNHNAKLLHHNKFIIFDRRAVFAGAGNFTGDAFTKNFENYYFIRTPEVVHAMAVQYEHLFGRLATAPDNLPKEMVMP